MRIDGHAHPWARASHMRAAFDTDGLMQATCAAPLRGRRRQAPAAARAAAATSRPGPTMARRLFRRCKRPQMAMSNSSVATSSHSRDGLLVRVRKNWVIDLSPVGRVGCRHPSATWSHGGGGDNTNRLWRPAAGDASCDAGGAAGCVRVGAGPDAAVAGGHGDRRRKHRRWRNGRLLGAGRSHGGRPGGRRCARVRVCRSGGLGCGGEVGRVCGGRPPGTGDASSDARGAASCFSADAHGGEAGRGLPSAAGDTGSDAEERRAALQQARLWVGDTANHAGGVARRRATQAERRAVPPCVHLGDVSADGGHPQRATQAVMREMSSRRTSTIRVHNVFPYKVAHDSAGRRPTRGTCRETGASRD